MYSKMQCCSSNQSVKFKVLKYMNFEIRSALPLLVSLSVCDDQDLLILFVSYLKYNKFNYTRLKQTTRSLKRT